jgi:hypothetical protein
MDSEILDRMPEWYRILMQAVKRQENEDYESLYEVNKGRRCEDG